MFFPLTADAQSPKQERKMVRKIEKFFNKYKLNSSRPYSYAKFQGYEIDDGKQRLNITVDDILLKQNLSSSQVSELYGKLANSLPKPYRTYTITIYSGGAALGTKSDIHLSEDSKFYSSWSDDEDIPWVTNRSLPTQPSGGLQKRNISLWASHGRYYDVKNNTWKWQRPKMFGTCEDLFTQTIVVPYLIPMLENAGANVFTPRERDWQTNEVVIDNDHSSKKNYHETNGKHRWRATVQPGFGWKSGNIKNDLNPFTNGTARMVESTGKEKNLSSISWTPTIPDDGEYAVYVSYQTVVQSVPDARYTVWHKGCKTEFSVNQRIGGGTWVYLGTFSFDKGHSEYNRVELSNLSERNGIVTADAVRFGGGMGNIERGGDVSGLPRCLEGARYYAQWAGMPYNIYSTKNGADDYGDDINVRSLMTNTLGGGSKYQPNDFGLKVPFELTLAVHSDAFYGNKNPDDVFGTLTICTTDESQFGTLANGESRSASKTFAQMLLDNTVADINHKYGRWTRRELWDKNYSETRLPHVTSAIIETMSHQNFTDMKMGQDPNFKFTLARSIYKTILRYVANRHGETPVVQPLTPDNFRIRLNDNGEAFLNWDAVNDPYESSAKPSGYIVYMAVDDSDFDNGVYIKGAIGCKIKLEPGRLYSFRVAAVNKGGRSFPTEVMCALYNPNATKQVLIINGFHRVASPQVNDDAYRQGFDFDSDPGITYGKTIGWAGKQLVFDRSVTKREGYGCLGWCGDEFTGRIIAGNDFNYVTTHARAIMSAGRYSIVSCSSHAIENGYTTLDKDQIVDVVLGLERNDGYSLGNYKTFTARMQSEIMRFVKHGGSIIASGSYIGQDMTDAKDAIFLSQVLKCRYGGIYMGSGNNVNGLGTSIEFYHDLNSVHYAATKPNVMSPEGSAFVAMLYADGTSAGVAYQGSDYRAFTMGFPFECIKDSHKRSSIMRGILNFIDGK